MMIDIQPWPDYVIILGVRVDRPSYVSRSAWVDFWTERRNA